MYALTYALYDVAVKFDFFFLCLSESRSSVYDDDEEEKEIAEVMEVDQLIQEELGGWMEVQPRTEEEEEAKVAN